MPALARRYRAQPLLRDRLGFLCRLACMALGLGVAGVAETSTGSASAAAGVPLPAEVQGKQDQSKLGQLTAALKAAEARSDTAGEARIWNTVGEMYFGESNDSKALEAYQQALAKAGAARDGKQQAAALNGIGGCYRVQGQWDQAKQAFQQALEIAAKTGDLRGKATALNGLGWVSASTGQNRKALEYHTQALPLARQAADRELEAAILIRIGIVCYHLGENQKALDYDNQSLPISRELGDRTGEATALNNMGNVYFALGDNQNALASFKQALPIRHQVGDRAGEGATLFNIGLVYTDMGENQKALEYYDQALPIMRKLGNRGGEATMLSNIGDVYSNLGEKQLALEYYNQALPIMRELGDSAGEAVTLTNVGNVYLSLGENQKALDSYERILRITRQVGDRGGEAEILNNIGNVYSRLGENQKALDYCTQALPILREVGDRRGEADTLTHIGHAYSRLGEKQKALDSLGQALPVAAWVNAPQLQIDALEDLFDIEKVDRPSLAILYGKLAINLLQQLRGNIHGLQKELQETFLASIADQYHDLATLLISQGRLSEAQQVLNFLKDQEYKDYVRGEADEALGSLSLTPAERSAEEDYQKSTAEVVEQGRRWSELKQKSARTPDEEKEFQQLSDSLGKASRMMHEYFARIYKLFSEGGDANRQLANITDEAASLKEQIARMPHTVALYTVVSRDRYSVIVIAGPTMVAREYAIADKDLYRKVAAFRQVILDPARDPRPLAQELYRVLIGPIQADLEQARAQTLIWSLDGVLRYVPLAALYDGEHFLVEKYSLASFTPVSIARISERPDLSAVTAAAMGISQQFDETLQPLPKVETELESIVQDPRIKGADGVMPGTILLNANFTRPAMEQQLDSQHSVVHIASHFVMRPGDDSQSYLLLAGTGGAGTAYHMTVAEFRDNQKMSLQGTELLTLSACDTGIGGSSANGREVDGLATTAQRKGARAVISSLWQLNDNSTAELMSDFYKRWVRGGGKVMKAEALREAQLDLLRGTVDSQHPEADPSYAKPYYWAPFVLMGNWQ